jgi:hypothetical protein
MKGSVTAAACVGVVGLFFAGNAAPRALGCSIDSAPHFAGRAESVAWVQACVVCLHLGPRTVARRIRQQASDSRVVARAFGRSASARRLVGPGIPAAVISAGCLRGFELRYRR